jgi:hypothetical protein
MFIVHHVSKEELDRLFHAVAKFAPMYTVIGAKNTLDPEDPDYSPAYVSEQFATLEEAERNATASGYPLTKIETDADWIAPAWWHAMYAFGRRR